MPDRSQRLREDPVDGILIRAAEACWPMLFIVDELREIRENSVERFFQRWYGPPQGIHNGLSVPDFDIPQALIGWHVAAAAVGVPVTFQDHPIQLKSLSINADRILPFWIENQHAYVWAVKVDDRGHRVRWCEVGSDEWRDSGEDLERFLLHCTVREAIIGSVNKFTIFLDDAGLSQALDSFSPTEFCALATEEPEAQLWHSADALARVANPPAGYGIPHKRTWMLTIAVQYGAYIEHYAGRLGVSVPPLSDSDQFGTFQEPPPF